MVRWSITLEIGMIDGHVANVRDDFYYEGLHEEATLRIHESLFYDIWRHFCPAAPEEYKEFKWFWG